MLFICPRCARAVSGHVVVVTPKSLMNSRRLITCLRSPEHGIVTGQSGRLEVVRSGVALNKVKPACGQVHSIASITSVCSAPMLAEYPAVGDVANERMLERVLQIGK